MMAWPDILVFGLIGLVVVVNAIYGSGLLIRWIWKKLRRKENE